MERLIGIAFKDFALLAADKTLAHSIIAVKHDEQKIVRLDSHLVLGVGGEAGDTKQFAEFIAKNVALYRMRNGFPLDPKSAAHFVRRNLAESLRSRSAYAVNCLLLGFDSLSGKPQLFYLDHLATGIPLPFARHGYPAYFGTSVLDKNYREDATRDEALALLRQVVQEIQKRLILSLPTFQVVLVDRDGVHQLPDLILDPSKTITV